MTDPIGPNITATVDGSSRPNPVQLDVTFADPSTVAGWQITRNDPGTSVTLFVSDGATAALSVVDYGAPFGKAVTYTLTVTRADLTTFAVTSNAVTVVEVGCWLTNPVDGSSLPVTLVAWPEREREGRSALLDVLGRADPVGLIDEHRTPSGTWSLYTATDVESDELTAMLTPRSVVQLRSGPERSIKSVTVLVGTVKERRYTSSGFDQRRMHVADVQEVAAVPSALPLSATLGGLHSLIPGNLGDMANYRPTLLALSQVRTP